MVKNDQKGARSLNGVDKVALQAALADQDRIRATPAYYNAPWTARDDYDRAVATGQQVLNDPRASQDAVTDALNRIMKAKRYLTGKGPDLQALRAAVADQMVVQATSAYVNASNQQDYDDAVAAGQALLGGTGVTEGQVTAAIEAINAARANLNGAANLLIRIGRKIPRF